MTRIESYIKQLNAKHSLSESESAACLNAMLRGRVSDAHMYTILRELSEKGESIPEMVGFAKAMRKHMVRVKLADKLAIDVCGTGGSGRDRFNLSTAVAFVLASMGVTVAKHGNVGSRKPNGSFDFLKALGVPYGQTPEELALLAAKQHLCFLFAKSHHPAMRHVAKVRQELGRRTLFNLLGPLSNPAGVSYQIVGTLNHAHAKQCAQVAQQLKTKRSLFVVADNGLDELSHQVPSHIYDVTKKEIGYWSFDPRQTEWYTQEDVFAGETATKNATFFKHLISGKKKHIPTLNALSLNAGLALLCIGKVDHIESGASLAKVHIESGEVGKFFETFKQIV